MLWIMLLTAHLIGIVGYTLLIRKSTLGRLNNLLLAALMQTAVFLPSLYYLFAGQVNFNLSPQQWLFVSLSGVMVAGLMITNVWALSHLEASMFTILYNLRLIFVTFLGFLILGEQPSLLQAIGGSIIFLSIILLNLHKNNRWRSKPILIGLLTMVWFSFHAVLEKYNLQSVNIETYIFIFGLIGTILIWLIVLFNKIDIKSQLEHIKDSNIYWLLITRVMSAYGYLYALKLGSLAVTNYVSGMSVALIVLFGIFVLGERDLFKQKIAAVAMACVGLSVILIDRLI
ncbi:EamA family transporter [Candidatus Saccharibacteria bacterium]|nr:EamA family transporter [Candidatus Saccharibacteria bacterium]MBP9132078.1 EamA family transporter [Candidatus Saccharibacteria bacterium]